jgi:hypothetical protein
MSLHPNEPNQGPLITPAEDPQVDPIPPGTDPSEEDDPKPDLV